MNWRQLAGEFVDAAKDATNIRRLSDVVDASDFKPGTRITANALFPKDPAGRSLSNLYSGRRVNPVIYGGVLLATGLNQASSMRSAIAEGTAVQESEARKMQGLSYSGWDPRMHVDNRRALTDNMGADGQLALALHYNRHG